MGKILNALSDVVIDAMAERDSAVKNAQKKITNYQEYCKKNKIKLDSSNDRHYLKLHREFYATKRKVIERIKKTGK